MCYFYGEYVPWEDNRSGFETLLKEASMFFHDKAIVSSIRIILMLPTD